MICVCGKERMDGIKCKFGASHLSYEESVCRYRALNPHVRYPSDVKPDNRHPAVAIAALPVRERLPVKRERLEPAQGRLRL